MFRIKNLNTVSYILLLLLLIQLGFFIWAINKGFDFTDESYGYLGFKHPEEGRTAATYYTIIFNAFFGWMGVSILKVRILRLSLLLFCGLVFAFGLSKWLKRVASIDVTQHVNLILFVLLGSLLINAHGDQSFTYNISSNFLLQLIIGGFFYSYQQEKRIKRFDLILFCSLGALLFLLFAVKFSNAILLSFLILVMLIYDKRNVKVITVYAFTMLAGGLAMGLLLFKGSFPDWIINYKNTLEFLSNSSSTSIWLRYIEDFKYTLSSKIINHSGVIIITMSLLLVNRRWQNKWTKAGIPMFIGVLMMYVSYSSDYYLGGPKHYYIYTGLYILLASIFICTQLLFVVIDRIRNKNQNTTVLKAALLLLMIPLCGAIGTGNLLSIQIIWYMSFFFAAIYLLLHLNGAFILNIVVVVLGINCTFQSVSGLIYYPYRINQTLHEESRYVSEKVSNEKVQLNPKLKESVESAHALIYSKTSFEKGDPIFSASPDYYGFIYLLDGLLPGWGWYDEKATAMNCNNLKNTSLKNMERMIIFMPVHYEMDSIYVKCFTEMNVNFPDNYVKLGDVRYFMGEADRTFTIHVPKTSLKE